MEDGERKRKKREGRPLEERGWKVTEWILK
jgi:hypothetical protein